MGTQEGSSFWLPSLVQPASPASINLSRHARMCWSPEQLLHPLLHSLAHTRRRPEEEDEQHDIDDERPVCWPFHLTQIGTLQWRTYMAIYHPCTHPGATASMHALATIHAPRPPRLRASRARPGRILHERLHVPSLHHLLSSRLSPRLDQYDSLITYDPVSLTSSLHDDHARSHNMQTCSEPTCATPQAHCPATQSRALSFSPLRGVGCMA